MRVLRVEFFGRTHSNGAIHIEREFVGSVLRVGNVNTLTLAMAVFFHVPVPSVNGLIETFSQRPQLQTIKTKGGFLTKMRKKKKKQLNLL